jgi:hypothetical protein
MDEWTAFHAKGGRNGPPRAPSWNTVNDWLHEHDRRPGSTVERVAHGRCSRFLISVPDWFAISA